MVLYVIFLCIVVFLSNPIILLVTPDHVSAQEEKELSPLISEATFDKFLNEIKEGFSYLLKVQTYGSIQKVYNDSILNPNNQFLRIPKYTADLELRPDFSLDYWRLKLSIKPRLHAYWQGWDRAEGSYRGESHHVEGYVNEWLASLRLAENLFVSYGQENLQWGPSFLISPSNPFFRTTGRANPKMEIPGMDFARLVWLYNPSFTISFIANVDQGRQQFSPPFTFVRTYALKFDSTAKRKYFSVIASYQENNDEWRVPNDRMSLGGYGGWTVSDALLLYGEGTVTIGTNVLYPKRIELGPGQGYIILMAPTKADSSIPTGTLLLGGSYTFKFGSTVALEYVFNSPGYTKDQADLYFQLYERGSPLFLSSGERVQSIAALILTFSLNTGLRLLRQNYLMFQIAHPQLWDVLTISSRAVYNIDDGSYMLSPLIEYNLGKHFGIFLIGGHNFGPKKSEFRSIAGYSWMVGLEYTF
jgi:hypothetical protein